MGRQARLRRIKRQIKISTNLEGETIISLQGKEASDLFKKICNLTEEDFDESGNLKNLWKLQL